MHCITVLEVFVWCVSVDGEPSGGKGFRFLTNAVNDTDGRPRCWQGLSRIACDGLKILVTGICLSVTMESIHSIERL